MKAVQKRLLTQKGFSPIFLVIGIVVVVATLGVSLLNSNKETSNTSQQSGSQDQIGLDTLDTVEDQDYKFFYPKGYVKIQPQAGSGTVLHYQNPENIIMGNIVLKVLEAKTKLGRPNYQICLGYGEKGRKKADDEITVEVTNSHPDPNSLEVNGIGCKIVRKTKLENSQVRDTAVAVERDLWRDENSTTYYASAVVYYESAPQSEKDKLTQAVESFSLK